MSHTYHTPDGPFTLPQQWREFLGPDVLSYRTTIRERYTYLGIERHSLFKLLKQSEGFCFWYDIAKQRKLAHAKVDLQSVADKVVSSNLERYGVRCTLQNPVIAAKRLATVRDRYGVDNVALLKEVQDAIKSTNNAKYGGNSPQHSKVIMSKSRETLMRNYGVLNPCQSPECFSRQLSTANVQHISQFGTSLIENIRQRLLDYSIFPFDFPITMSDRVEHTGICLKCGSVFRYHFSSSAFPTACPHCLTMVTKFESDLIKRLSKDFPEVRKGTLADHRSIDIFFPSQKIGFEINGAFSHNAFYCPLGPDAHKAVTYHRDKTDQALKQGIRLYHLWEDSITVDLAESIIRAKLGFPNNKMFARKLLIKEVSSQELRSFYDANHAQGAVQGFLNIALCSDSEIISSITFRKRSNTSVEIARNCTIKGVFVIGGFSRMFKFACGLIKQRYPEISQIVTFANRDLSPTWSDTVYARHGFLCTNKKCPSLTLSYYVSTKALQRKFGGIIINRRRLQKQFLKGLFPDVYDPNLTEQQILVKVGVYPIYNSGCYKFILSI